MKAKLCLLSVFLYIIKTLNCLGSGIAPDEVQFRDAVFSDDIRTVMFYVDGDVQSAPVLELNSDARLLLKFDDLSGNVKSYSYSIIHCDFNWRESRLLSSEYLDGFQENPLNDYVSSINTTFSYINYQLAIPNDDVQLKLSGNYILVVFETDNRDKIVLSRRFQVVEPMVVVDGTVKRASFDPFKGGNQEVDFTIRHPNLRIQNPREEVKVVVMQNRRWDNAITNLKPLFIRQNELSYDYSKENVFQGGNEFRYFDIRTRRYNGENVGRIEFFRPYYHVTLLPDEVRSNKAYRSYGEMNGNYVVESQDRITDTDTECDYFFVHFTLPLEAPLAGGKVYVFGALSNWQVGKSIEMTWNFEHSAYELSLLLKQGYYNFEYVYMPNGSAKLDDSNLEGSFWETENDYRIFVYYRDVAGTYDRLVGYSILNSRKQK